MGTEAANASHPGGFGATHSWAGMKDSPGILLVGNFPPPYGGVPSHLQSLGPFLARAGWRVHVLTPKYSSGPTRVVDGVTVWSHAPSSTPQQLRDLVFRCRDVVSHAPYLLKEPRRFLYLLHYAEQIARIVRDERIALISAYHILPAGLVSAWVSRQLSVPLVTSVFGEVWMDTTLFAQRRRETSLVLGTSDLMLSVSDHCANGLRRHGYPVEVSYYGVDLDRFSGAARADLNDRPGDAAAFPKPGEPVVLFVGRLEAEMGLGVLLDALPDLKARCPEAKVVVAGRQGGLTTRALAAAADDPSRVFVCRDASDEAISSLYALARVVAVPSTNERACLGLAVAEASASGRPVVVANAGGGREILAPGGGTLVPPQDSEALVEALLPYLGDEDLATDAGKIGRAFIERHFDAKQTNAAIAERFASLIR